MLLSVYNVHDVLDRNQNYWLTSPTEYLVQDFDLIQKEENPVLPWLQKSQLFVYDFPLFPFYQKPSLCNTSICPRIHKTSHMILDLSRINQYTTEMKCQIMIITVLGQPNSLSFYINWYSTACFMHSISASNGTNHRHNVTWNNTKRT